MLQGHDPKKFAVAYLTSSLLLGTQTKIEHGPAILLSLINLKPTHRHSSSLPSSFSPQELQSWTYINTMHFTQILKWFEFPNFKLENGFHFKSISMSSDYFKREQAGMHQSLLITSHFISEVLEPF